MKIIVDNELKIFATHENSQNVESLYAPYKTLIVPDDMYTTGQVLTVEQFQYLISLDINKKTIITHYEFLTRLTDEEHVAIEIAMPSDPILRIAKQRFDAAQEIDLNNPDIIKFVNYMKSIGLLTEARAQNILRVE